MAFNRKILLAALAVLSACAATQTAKPEAAKPASPGAAFAAITADPYPSTYHRYPGVVTAITGATIYDGEGGRIDNGTVVLADGLVSAVGGPDTPLPAGAARVDATANG